MPIIAFGGAMTAGKTYAASYVAQHVYNPTIAAFADEVKSIAMCSFGWDGQKDERGRRLLQVIGTEAGREYNPDIWVNKLERTVKPLMSDHTIIIHDCRFPNEVDWVRDNLGIAILIKSPYALLSGLSTTHASETAMYDANWSTFITNNKDEQFLEDLKNLLISLGVEWIA